MQRWSVGRGQGKCEMQIADGQAAPARRALPLLRPAHSDATGCALARLGAPWGSRRTPPGSAATRNQPPDLNSAGRSLRRWGNNGATKQAGNTGGGGGSGKRLRRREPSARAMRQMKGANGASQRRRVARRVDLPAHTAAAVQPTKKPSGRRTSTAAALPPARAWCERSTQKPGRGPRTARAGWTPRPGLAPRG